MLQPPRSFLAGPLSGAVGIPSPMPEREQSDEEAESTNLHGAPDLPAGEEVRGGQVPRRTRSRTARQPPQHEREPGQGN